MKLSTLVMVAALLALSACSAKNKPCLDQLQACGEKAFNCAIACSTQGGCVVDQCVSAAAQAREAERGK